MLTEAIGRKCSQGEKVCKTPSTAYLTLSENEAYALRSPSLLREAKVGYVKDGNYWTQMFIG